MNPPWLQLAGKLALLAVLAGIFYRRRQAECWSFVAYVAIVLGFTTVVSMWPERFFVWSFRIIQQSFYDAAKLAVALELGGRAFHAFSQARARARLVFAGVLLATTLAIVFLPPPAMAGGQTVYERFFFQWEPRVINGTVWLLAGTALLVVWFNVPVSQFHRAISVGFASYLVLFVSILDLLRSLDWRPLPSLNLVNGLAYLSLSLYWAWAAWQPRTDEAAQERLREQLRAVSA